MFLPIALGVMTTVGGLVEGQAEGEHNPERLRLGRALMLSITYGITIGRLLLPIGSPPNLIGREFIEEATNEPITFFEWLLVAAPIVVVMFVLVMAALIALNRPEIRRVSGADADAADRRRHRRDRRHPLRAWRRSDGEGSRARLTRRTVPA
jgi:sodium-dependent dicarboxylate transporter 2/3/5